jgi:hypothetical protein
MINKLLALLGLHCEQRQPLPPQIGNAIDKDALKAMHGGAVAFSDRPKGKIHIAIRRAQNGVFGFVLESGIFYPDTVLDWETYGKPNGWQAYEIAPFEDFMPAEVEV